mgnify:CR=1 FL=1
MNVFERHESEVRSYCRHFPTVFTRARGARLWDEQGREFIDFFAGAGALNYGHNDPAMRRALVEYLTDDGIVHSLDMSTRARGAFLEAFNATILEPRGLRYKVMFPGPTGTNSVEAALKLARKVTGRRGIVSFTNGYHGMTLGALAATGNPGKRAGAGTGLPDVAFMPYDGVMGADVDTLDYFETMLDTVGSGLDLPAGVIVECIQGEGGLNAARIEWLQRLERLCRERDIRLIVDEVQTGCGRTGPFFAFEAAGLRPDIVCVSKSISGFGLPLALTLIAPEYDRFSPGEHNGTFRGQNLALVTAVEALHRWEGQGMQPQTERHAATVRAALESITADYGSDHCSLRGRGLMQGIAVAGDGRAETVCRAAFERGLILETAGARSQVVKLFPPLNIPADELERGLEILRDAFGDAARAAAPATRVA